MWKRHNLIGALGLLGLLVTLLWLGPTFVSWSAADTIPGNDHTTIPQGLATERTLAGAWIRDCVECSPWFDDMTEHHLQLDAQGYPHVAYGGEYLYYAWQTAEGWHYQTVDDTPDIGSYASLRLDGAGYAHIGYMNSSNTEIRYAYQDAAGWHTETVTSTVGSAFGPDLDLVLGPGGEPHFGYCANEPKYKLRYTYRDAAGWHFETVDTNLGNGGWDVSMAIDVAGYVHIAYYDSINKTFQYVYQTDQGWQIGTHLTDLSADIASTAREVCGTPNLVLDGNGFAHIAYPIWDSLDQWSFLYYSYRDESGWHGEIAEWLNVCADISLAVDSRGNPHLGVQESLAVDLQYLHKDATGWHIETVDSEGWTGYSNSIAVDASGRPHISYYDQDQMDLRYAYLDAGNWQLQILDDGSRVAASNSLVLDGNDMPHISYYENIPARTTVKYSYPGATGWTIEIVESGAFYVGSLPSMALDGSGYPHLAYYRPVDGGGLAYAYRDTGGWQVEEIDDEWRAGRGASLALDDDDYPHISYATNPNDSDLKYIFQDVDGWHITVVDPGGKAPTSLVLDGAGLPHISYTVDAGLRYAYYDGLEWHIQAVDSGPAIGYGNSMVLDNTGHPHISYCDQISPAVKYAYWTASGWQIQTLEDSYATQTSLVLDPDGNLHLSYGTGTILKYAYKDAGGWHITVADDGDGGSPSLALDQAGQPHIVYGGVSPHYDLKYTYRLLQEFAIYLPLVLQQH